MSRFLFIFFNLTTFYLLLTTNLLAQANNKVGVHIFDPNEIDQVADLVNSNGGDWGYVTVPLRSDDRNREKWQEFMHKCTKYHIIPIIRLATTVKENYWTRPTDFDYIYFANFLADLDWPVKNRYVIVYNEPNHALEWGGQVNANQYAHELNRTREILKERNSDFFVLPAGLDAAAPTDRQHLKWRTFIHQMWAATTDSLTKIDGWNSHSYPNPAFSGSPNDKHDHSIRSFTYEMTLVKSLTGKDLPIFITETGWSNQNLDDQTIAQYYKTAFFEVWNSENIKAVTPFVLHAGAGPFAYFSLLDQNGSPKPQYQTLKWISKTKGEPQINILNTNIKPILGAQDSSPSSQPKLTNSSSNQLYDTLELIIKWLKMQ